MLPLDVVSDETPGWLIIQLPYDLSMRWKDHGCKKSIQSLLKIPSNKSLHSWCEIIRIMNNQDVHLFPLKY